MPDVSVVVATRNRAPRLSALLECLADQTLAQERFEVIIVDDASSDATPELLARIETRGEIDLRSIRRHRAAGPAAARQDGWLQARADVIAFTDDDCRPEADWLEHVIEASYSHPGAIVQGTTSPDPAESQPAGPFRRTVSISAPDGSFQTCNIVYPRAVLESVGGFDVEGFSQAPFMGGEDSDLAWRAINAGAETIFVPGLRVHHAIEWMNGPDKVRSAVRGTMPMLAYARHPELRRAHFVKGVFWKGSHYLLIRALIGVLAPRPLRWLKPWLIGPYFFELKNRLQEDPAGVTLVPYLVLYDLLEVGVVVRGAVRFRRLML